MKPVRRLSTLLVFAVVAAIAVPAIALGAALATVDPTPPPDPASFAGILDFVMQAFALLKAGGWLPLSVLVVGFVARLLKSDTKIPINIPARWQPFLVLFLGQAAAILTSLEHVGAGLWLPVLAKGLFTALITMGLFDVLVKAVFNGKDLPSFLSFLLKAEAVVRGEAPPAGDAPKS